MAAVTVRQRGDTHDPTRSRKGESPASDLLVRHMWTDYPYDMGEINPIGFIEGSQALADSERRLVFGGNAARLLGIEPPPARANG